MSLTKKQQRLRRARQTRIRIATQGVVRLLVNRTNLHIYACLLYTSPSPRDQRGSRMPSSA